MTITTVASVPGIFVTMYALDAFGRKRTLVLSYTVCGATLFALMLGAVQSMKALSVSLLALNRICGTISSFALYVYFAEFYPTAIRATSLGFANALSRFGGMLATYVSRG